MTAHGSDHTAPADATLDGYVDTMMAAVEQLGAGHMAMLSHPAEVAAAITDLAASHH